MLLLVNEALSTQSGSNQCVAIGYATLESAPKDVASVTAVGYAVGASLSDSLYHSQTLIGQSAGYSAGQNVVAVGTKSAYRIGIESTAIGTEALSRGKGSRNTAVGMSALRGFPYTQKFRNR